MGASLSINTLAAALGLKKGMIPPTIGYKETDSKIGLNVINEESLNGKFRYFMVNGYDVTGGVYSLILGAV